MNEKPQENRLVVDQDKLDRIAESALEEINSNSKLSKTRDLIVQEFKKRACERHKSRYFSDLTIGIEHEFFLMNRFGTTCSTVESQSFMQELQKTLSGCELVLDKSGSNIICAAVQIDGRRYAKIKYEVAPHLLEISASFDTNLNNLNRQLLSIFEALNLASLRQGLQVVSESFIPHAAITESSFIKSRENIHSTRKAFAKRVNPNVSDKILNFTSCTASTQFHIGGLDWWSRDELMNRLYQQEPGILGLIQKTLNLSQTDLSKRHLLYSSCFPGMALIGYPSFSKWSAENWAAGLMTGPPLSYLKSKDVGLPVFMIETDDRSVNIEDFSLLRDFQIIRPRLFGTLEYRGNGSCGGVEKIMAATAIRLASVLLALDSKKDSVITYQQGREHWLKLLETTNPVYPEELEARVRRVLELRGLNEEKYLP